MENRQKYIDGIFRYCSHHSLLVLGNDGIITRLKCPFKVHVVIPISKYQRGFVLWVEYVDISKDLKLLYLIDKIAYPYYHFLILR